MSLLKPEDFSEQWLGVTNRSKEITNYEVRSVKKTATFLANFLIFALNKTFALVFDKNDVETKCA